MTNIEILPTAGHLAFHRAPVTSMEDFSIDFSEHRTRPLINKTQYNKEPKVSIFQERNQIPSKTWNSNYSKLKNSDQEILLSYIQLSILELLGVGVSCKFFVGQEANKIIFSIVPVAEPKI